MLSVGALCQVMMGSGTPEASQCSSREDPSRGRKVSAPDHDTIFAGTGTRKRYIFTAKATLYAKIYSERGMCKNEWKESAWF